MDSNEEREGPGTFSEWQERALFADVVTVGQSPGCRVPSKVTRFSEVRDPVRTVGATFDSSTLYMQTDFLGLDDLLEMVASIEEVGREDDS